MKAITASVGGSGTVTKMDIKIGDKVQLSYFGKNREAQVDSVSSEHFTMTAPGSSIYWQNNEGGWTFPKNRLVKHGEKVILNYEFNR